MILSYNPVIFTIGKFDVRWYSVFILLGVIVGISLFEKEGTKHAINKDFLFNMAFWTIIFGIIGARIYYVIFNIHLYKDDIWSIFKIWEGGLAIHGAIITGFITIAFYCFKYKFPLLKLLDMVVPSLIIGQAIGRWGNFFNGEAHGMQTTLEFFKKLHIPSFIIKGMEINGVYYEPTFLYESIICLIGFLIIILMRRFNKYLKVGALTSFYLMWYSLCRFFIEWRRTDSLMLGGFKTAQVISIVLFVIGFILFIVKARKSKYEDLYSEDYNQKIQF